VLLLGAVVLQILYEFKVFGKEPVTFEYILRFVAIGLALAALAAYGRLPMVHAAIRLMIGLNFLYSIADRFGALGPYHTVGVSWGNWKNFVYYTHVLNGFLPASAAPYLAVAATLLEAALAVLLILGILPRIAALVTATLLTSYIITMSLSSGFVSQLDFAVLLLACAAFFVACTDPGARASLRRSLPGLGGI
jgi:putative oxidoreductase